VFVNARRFALLSLLVALTACGGEKATVPGPDPRALAFVGDWRNVDPGTSEITRVRIRTDSGRTRLFVAVWGSCEPTDCEWGELDLAIAEGADGVLALHWDPGFKTDDQILEVLEDGRLRLIGHVHYTDGSGRLDRDYVNYFRLAQ
jgi:hypothetical protein